MCAAFKDISYIGILQIQYITCEDFYYKFNLYLQFIYTKKKRILFFIQILQPQTLYNKNIFFQTSF